MILVLGEPSDPHTRRVLERIEKNGEPYLTVDPFETVHLPDLTQPEAGAGFTAIWDRLKPVAPPRSARDQYICRERLAAVRSLQFNGPSEGLMNHPNATESARSKAFQMKVAKDAGLAVPRTYIGNNPAAVRAFVESCPAGAIAKSLTWYYSLSGRYTFTNMVDPDTLKSDAAIALSPMIYQEYVRKNHELRATFVGDHVFTAKINSQKDDTTAIDWRRDQFNVEYERTELPAELRGKLKQVLEALGLNYGAIDLIVTPDGGYVFLEVNATGNWLWIEELLSLPISDAIATWLCKQRH